MGAVPLFPFPRVQEHVSWSGVRLIVNGQPTEPGDLADRWDSDSLIRLSINAQVPSREIAKLELLTGPSLVLTVGCNDTSESFTTEVDFKASSSDLQAAAEVEFDGSRVAQRLTVRASVTAPFGDVPWLKRRILAERPVERINLDSELSGFPTTAMSFSESSLPAAPWTLAVFATALSDPFAHSIRLNLNTDFPRVEELIFGRPEPYVENALQVAITRALIQTARRLADEAGSDAEIRIAVTEYPESIAASADKACRDYLRRSLEEVITLARRQPERLDTLIDSAFGILREKR